MSVLASFFKSLAQSKTPLKIAQTLVIPARYKPKERRHFVVVPKPGQGKCYRRKVHFPEEYTVEPLRTTNLAGRDPVTGRVVVGTLGGGVKYKYHWVKFYRDGPSEDPPQEERVLDILKCGCRTANIALVAVKDELKYILATENMKAGDIIKTSKVIPLTPILANEGDAYPLGALPPGTPVHCIQIHPSKQTTFVHAAGSVAIIKKHINEQVIVQMPSKKEMTFERECMATVGRLSNVSHSSTPIGSAQKLRELGYRPRSGLKQRKTGRFGRKIKPLPPVGHYTFAKPKREFIRCTLMSVKI